MFTVQMDLTGKCWEGGNTKELIIVHHTGSSNNTTYDQILRFFRLSEMVSAHYVVGKYGEITQMVREDDRAWHAGKSSWNGKTNLNSCSIGIEILSDGHNFTNEQREAVRWLCHIVAGRNNIQPHNILKHSDVSPDRKWDVGRNFWNPYFGKSWSDFQIATVRRK